MTTDTLRAALTAIADPVSGTTLGELNAVRDITLDNGHARITLQLGYPAAGIREKFAAQVASIAQQTTGVTQATVDVTWRIAAHEVQPGVKPMPNVKNIIAVASGKGGVGKSTTAVNLALALQAEGARVGLLDADIYGPSQSVMTGIPKDTRPETRDGKYFVPLLAHGIQVMSMGFLVDKNTPMVWRGPMVSGALQQLLNQTLWDDLDYMIIDMPPGTGDIQLTLSQSVPVTGAVIVTTPQDIALLDAVKGIEMFRKVHVPIVGIIENMSLHTCSQCGHTEHLFGAGGGERIAHDYDTALLGSLPLDIRIREQADAGTPMVAAEPNSDITNIYRDIARKVGASIAIKARQSSIPNIVMVND